MSNGLSHWILNNISGQGSKYLRFVTGEYIQARLGFSLKPFKKLSLDNFFKFRHALQIPNHVGNGHPLDKAPKRLTIQVTVV